MGTLFVASGGLRRVSSNFEWPVGSAKGVLIMPNKELVVPLEAIGRIQIYDANTKFLRGWWVDGGKGGIKFKLAGTNMFEAWITRDDARYLYDLDGHLHFQGTYQLKDWNDLPLQSEPASIPTSWWLWSFEGPFHSWITMIIGGLFIILGGRKTEFEKAEPPPI